MVKSASFPISCAARGTEKRVRFNVESSELLSKLGLLSWLNDLFERHEEYGTPSVTLIGQHVRSKGERVIADYFTHHGIPYYYEAMATTNDWFIFKSKISKPDFYLPQYTAVVWTSF